MVSRQDGYTFLIGLGAAVAIEVAASLLEGETVFTDTRTWLQGLATGIMSATGRYLLTWLTQRGFQSRKVK